MWSFEISNRTKIFLLAVAVLLIAGLGYDVYRTMVIVYSIDDSETVVHHQTPLKQLNSENTSTTLDTINN